MTRYFNAVNSFQAKIESLTREVAEQVFPGLAIGAICDGQRLVWLKGFRDLEQQHPVQEDTMFEIGSVTKPFTAILLTEMVSRGLVGLDDPIGKYLPDDIDWVANGVYEITFRELAYHQSSLPRLPVNLDETIIDPHQPYENFSVEDLLMALQKHQAGKGKKVEEYSNFGYGLLGYLLGQIHGSDYETALRELVLQPLGLGDTACKLSEDQTRRLAQPTIVKGVPVPAWVMPEAVMGAGGLRSTLADMMIFLQANLHPENTPLESTLGATRQVRSFWKKAWWPSVLVSIMVWLAVAYFLSSRIPFGPAASMSAFYLYVSVCFAGGDTGKLGALLVNGLLVLGTWWVWREQFYWCPHLIFGSALALLLSHAFWKKARGTLAWSVEDHRKGTVFWHNGMVGGSAAFIGFMPKRSLGVVVLASAAKDVDWIGFQLLEFLSARPRHQPLKKLDELGIAR